MKRLFSILIVHFETPDLLRQCLQAIFSAQIELSFQVIVIDNASQDEDVKRVACEFPDVVFQFNSANVGFAAACNQGLRICNERFVLVLNPDTLIQPDVLEQWVKFMHAHPNVGACGARLLYPDGKLQLSCRNFPTVLALVIRIFRLGRLIPGPVNKYLMSDWDHAEVREVDWIIGGCMMLRREAVVDVGLFDEGFFMYYEDTDLCYRLKRKGWQVYYNPQVSALHHHRRMSARLLPNRLSFIHASSLLRLFQKHKFAWH